MPSQACATPHSPASSTRSASATSAKIPPACSPTASVASRRWSPRPKRTIAATHDVGPVAAAEIRDWLATEGNQLVLAKLAAAGVEPREVEKAEPDEALRRQELRLHRQSLRPQRRAARPRSRRAGDAPPAASQKPTSSSSGEDAGSKADKARELGVTILSEEEFAAMLEKP